MSTEITKWDDEPAPVAHLVSAPRGPAPAAYDIDSWVEIASAYTRLASQIANTDFPPAEMRGKPEALVATFLMGREMGLGPMTALMNMHVIKGKVGQSAHLMRAQILSQGHEVEFDDVSDTRVTVRGRRRNEQSWTYVTFTADQARRAKIDLGGYPEDKLVARATARLARRKFADVISGMAYSVEELGDGDYAFEDDAVQVAEITAAAASGDKAPEPTRTAKRSAPTRTAPTTASAKAGRARRQSSAESATAGPPLPDEQDRPQGGETPDSDAPAAAVQTEGSGPGQPRRAAQGQNAPGDVTATAVVSGGPGEGGRGGARRQPENGPDAGTSAGAHASSPAAPETAMVTKNQLGKIGALFTDAGVSDREARLRVVSSMADRPISSSTGLTQDEASELIDNLADLGAEGIAAAAGAPAPETAPAEPYAGGQGQLGDEPEEDA